MEQRGQMAAMQQLESRSDEELEAETKNNAAAQAILGYRAAERYDAKAARAHFQRALAAARGPQERAGIRKMADASLALAVGMQLVNNTSPPPGSVKHTDTVVTVNLVYALKNPKLSATAATPVDVSGFNLP